MSILSISPNTIKEEGATKEFVKYLNSLDGVVARVGRKGESSLVNGVSLDEDPTNWIIIARYLDEWHIKKSCGLI